MPELLNKRAGNNEAKTTPQRGEQVGHQRSCHTTFRREETASKSVNNPFYDWTLKGRNAMTIVAGEIAWQ